MNNCDKCKHKISKKSFKNFCKDKLDLIRLQICRNEIEQLVYDLSICKDEKVEYVAIKAFLSPSTVKRILHKLYNRTANLPHNIYNELF